MLLDSLCLNTDIYELDVTITDNKSRRNLGDGHGETEKMEKSCLGFS